MLELDWNAVVVLLRAGYCKQEEANYILQNNEYYYYFLGLFMKKLRVKEQFGFKNK